MDNPFDPGTEDWEIWNRQEAESKALATVDSQPEPELQEKPRLDVSNVAASSDWLWNFIGTGRLSGMFKRNGELVQAVSIGEDGYTEPKDGDNGPAAVIPVTADRLAAEMGYNYWCYKYTQGKKDEPPQPVQTPFPVRAARDVVNTPHRARGLRSLRGVVHTPIIRKDGSVLSEPGFDNQTGLLHLPTGGLFVKPVSEEPTDDEVAQAAHLVMSMMADFPFVSDNDRVNYLGMLLTPLLRDIVPIPYKMFAINAHQMGSGKTLLATAARLVHGGIIRSEMPEDDAELRKQITSILDGTTGPVVHVDNVAGLVKSPILAGLLTSRQWDDRLLGSSKMIGCTNDRVWVITGNNIRLGGDLVRRTVMITIDPGMPDPQNRTDFKIPQLEQWVEQHRGEILHALLTLISAWVAAGMPFERTTSDSYAEWVGCINGIIGVAKLPGTFDAAESRTQSEGEEDSDWAAFLAELDKVFGDEPWTAKDAISRVNVSGLEGSIGKPIPIDKLPGNLGEQILRSPNPTLLAKSFGRWLMNRQGRWSGGRTVRSASKGRDGTLWRLERIAVGDDPDGG